VRSKTSALYIIILYIYCIIMGELESPTPGEPQFTTQGSSSSPGELQFPTHFLCTDKKIALILGALYLSHQNRSVFLTKNTWIP